jgi:hypothetical protein
MKLRNRVQAAFAGAAESPQRRICRAPSAVAPKILRKIRAKPAGSCAKSAKLPRFAMHSRVKSVTLGAKET